MASQGRRRLSAVAAHVVGATVSDDAAETLTVSFGDGASRALEPLSRPGRQAFPEMLEGFDQQRHLAQRRQAETGSSRLWRIHGKLYDLGPFLDHHPGGRIWLELTRGTDATAAFEAYHLDGAKVQAVLAGYYVRDVEEGEFAHGDRFTYEDNGFWRTLRRRVLEVLKSEAAPVGAAARPATGPTKAMRAACAACLAQFAAAHAVARSTGSVLMAALSGVFLVGVWGVGHNFMHQRESTAPSLAHAMDMTGMFAKDWRISHALSHHLDTNLLTDWEGTFAIPPLGERLNVGGKMQAVFPLMSGPGMLLLSLMYMITKARAAFQGADPQRWREILPGLLPILQLASYVRGRRSVRKGLALFCIQMGAFFACFTPLGAGVHHAATIGDHMGDASSPSPADQRGTLAWLEGQAGAQEDFGAHQVIATTDHSILSESIPSFLRDWLSLTFFGYLNNHTLHHLFPGVDQSRLHALRGVFEQTVREFGLEAEATTESRTSIVRGFIRYVMQRRVRSRL